MSNLRIYNVKGDGNCFYRCIWNIAKSDKNISESLNISDEEISDEEISITEIRKYVSLLLNSKIKYVNIIKNLIEIFKDTSSLTENYPILDAINLDKDLDYNCNIISNVINKTNIMASSVELEIIIDTFNELDIQLIVLTENRQSNINLADKWCRELYKMLDKITYNKITIIINENNIHYKYAKFNNKIIIDRLELTDIINKLMEESSESSEESESENDDIIDMTKSTDELME